MQHGPPTDTSKTTPAPPVRSAPGRRRRVALAARAVMLVVAFGIAVMLLALMLPAGREALLDHAVEVARDRLPGTVHVGRAAWPRLGTLAVGDVIWHDGPDTLAHLEDLELRLALGDLWRRDVTVRRVHAAGIVADLPAIAARLPAAPRDTALVPGASPPPSLPFFLRPGALPPLPSLAIEQVSIARVAVRTAPRHTARLDTLHLAVELRHGRPFHLAAALRARPLATLGVSGRLRGEVEADTLVLAFAPLFLAAPERLPALADLPLDGRVRLPLPALEALLAGHAAWPSLTIDALALAGDLGDWRLDARLDHRAAGRVTLRSELPAAPVALLAGLAALDDPAPMTPAQLDTLAARWAAHGPPGVDLTVDVVPPPAQAPRRARVEARGRVRLPAPAAIASLLPPQLVAADLGPVELDLDAAYDGTVDPAVWRATLDLGRTAWLDRAQLEADGTLAADGVVALDRALVELRLPGLAIAATGRADQDSLRLDASLDVPDASLLRRWRDLDPAAADPAALDLDLAGRARLRAHGRWSAPTARLDADVRVAAAGLQLPRAELSARLDPDTLHVRAHLPAGLTLPTAVVESATFTFAGAATDSLRRLRGRYDLQLAMPPVATSWRGHVDAAGLPDRPEVLMVADHLALSLDRRHLASTGPWRLTYSAADTTARLEGLQLAGTLGRFDLAGRVSPDSLEASLALDLRVPLEPVRDFLPPEQQDALPAGTVTATGRIAALGAPAAPWTTGDLRLALLDASDLADLAVEVALALGGSGPAPTTTQPGRLGWQAGSARLSARLLDHGQPAVTVAARVPWPLSGSVPDSVDLAFGAPSIDLGRLQPLLPAGHALSGTLAGTASVRGALPPTLLDDATTTDPLTLARALDLAIGLDLHLDDIAAGLPDGSALTAAGTLTLTGTTASPAVAANLEVAGDLGRLVLRADALGDEVEARADLDLRLSSDAVRPYLPLDQQPLLPRGILAVTGRLAAVGPAQAPWAHGDLQLAVVDEPDLAALTTTIDLHLGGRGDPPATLPAPAARWRAGSARVALRLLDGGVELLRLDALAPLPHLVAAADSVDMRLHAPGLELARLAPLLPPGTTVTGRLEASTRVAGLMTPGQPDPDLDLAGHLRVANLRAQLPEGSRLALRGRVDLAGTSLAPQIRGGLHVEGGLIRLPDPPPTLLPPAGEALLWQTSATPPPVIVDPDAPAATGPAPADTRGAPAPPGALPRVLPDLVLTLTSPGDLWLRGQGLDIELAGDLSLLLRGDHIAVEGELTAVQGTMRQLGHLFRLQRGRVVFDGSETELNPELDLALGVRVGQYDIGILLGGTALSPTLSFTSAPELSDGDILAALLFGKPLDELDEGQTGLLASRAAQIAAAYGSARLQDSLARQLGVDVLTIAPREGDEETTALTVGKYLSPRVLVRYEQLLREGSAFFVHLDYAFAGAFRLHTQVSQGEQSGVQLKWLRDW